MGAGRVVMLVARGVVLDGFLLNRILGHHEIDGSTTLGRGEHGHFERVEGPAGVAVRDFSQKIERLLCNSSGVAAQAALAISQSPLSKRRTSAFDRA